MAGFLLLYGAFFTFRRALPNIEKPTPLIDQAIGFLGGILGATAGLSGALPTMWCAMREWTKTEQRAVFQPFNVVILGISAALLAGYGVYDQKVVTSFAIALPVTLISTQVGILVFKKLTDTQFRRLVIALMLVSGIVLLTRELL